jgi:hypothetical protein
LCSLLNYKERYSKVQIENCKSWRIFVLFVGIVANKATDLDGRDNLYVHCVSKERLVGLELFREGMSCVELEILL